MGTSFYSVHEFDASPTEHVISFNNVRTSIGGAGLLAKAIPQKWGTGNGANVVPVHERALARHLVRDVITHGLHAGISVTRV